MNKAEERKERNKLLLEEIEHYEKMLLTATGDEKLKVVKELGDMYIELDYIKKKFKHITPSKT